MERTSEENQKIRQSKAWQDNIDAPGPKSKGLHRRNFKIITNAFWRAAATVVLCFLFPGSVRADLLWLEREKLLAADGAADDQLGQSVSISGNYAIVGAPYDDDDGYRSGSAYIFKWNGTSWVEQQKLTASDGAAEDLFGSSVSISGDLAIAGAFGDDDKGAASGSVYIFKRNGTSWLQQKKLTASDGASLDNFGYSVSLDGDSAIVGAYRDDDNGSDCGSVYIFNWDGSNWVQQQKITASDGAANDWFGCSVSISGGLAIVGAKGGNYGSAYICKWDGTSWAEHQKLSASDGAANDYFGSSVSISGDSAIVGAVNHDDNGLDSGSAYIFNWDGSNWVQQQEITAFDGRVYDYFGWSVSISGGLAIVGARSGDGNVINSGSAYIFKWDGTHWAQHQEITASDGAANDFFGESVSISGDLAIVGAHGDGSNSGSAYVFELIHTGTVTLAAPNGGENLVAGATFEISWIASRSIANILIEFSVNNGANWTAIDTVANTGSYKCTVADVDSSKCLVRVSNAEYPAANDVSDNVFRIYKCTLAHDVNHDCFVDLSDFADFAAEWLRCGDPDEPDCQI